MRAHKVLDGDLIETMVNSVERNPPPSGGGKRDN